MPPGNEELEEDMTEGKRFASVRPIDPHRIPIPPPYKGGDYPPEVVHTARRQLVAKISKIDLAHDKILFNGGRVIEILFKSGLIIGIYLLLAHLAESKGIKLPFSGNIWSILSFSVFYLTLDLTALVTQNKFLSQYLSKAPSDKPWN